jgi:hypothetical protein
MEFVNNINTIELNDLPQCCHGTGTGQGHGTGQHCPGHVSYFLRPGHIWDNIYI